MARLFDAIAHRPDEVAFRLEGRALTFGQLDAQARRYASGLAALGVGRGDRVASLLETSLEMVVALLGHYLLGAVHVPINTRYGQIEIEHILTDSGAAAILVDAHGPGREALAQVAPGALPSRRIVIGEGALDDGAVGFGRLLEAAPLEGPPPVEDEDPALFIYTSGTTGRSKGVVLPYRAVVANIDALTRLWRWQVDDVLALTLPLFHVHGLCIGVHGVLLRGCQAVLHRRFEPQAVVDEVAAGATIFMGVPTMYARLVRHLDQHPQQGAALGRARLFTSGSAALSADVFAAFEAHTGHRILERYGMSETLLTVSNPYAPHARKPGTIGFPVDSGEVLVADAEGRPCAAGEVGELVMRGASLMLGYWNAPEKTAEAMRGGWFLTGDVARYDDEGYIVHVGRSSVDIIKSGGFKISAREIEEAIARHPDVEDVGVVGLADDEWGERVAAAVVPRAGAPARDAGGWLDALRDTLDGQLADYKRPRQVLVLSELPRNALGKIQKHRIKAMAGEEG